MAIYLDNASTTQISSEVYQAMEPFLKQQFANPSSLYDPGIENRKMINQSRKTVAQLLHCDYKEIYFTASGSEANNWALKGLAARSTTRNEIITTKIEHHSILRTCEYLEQKGFVVHYLAVDRQGFIDFKQLEDTISERTLLVSIMLANNEIGVIQDLMPISKLCKSQGALFHTDATQAVCHLPIDFIQLGVDLMSFSAHKFNGPKGIGVLVIKNGIEIDNLIHGGGQELNKRAGTENLAYIVGLTKALTIGIDQLEAYSALRQVATAAYKRLQAADVRLNGPEIGMNRLAGNLNLSFKGIDGSLLTYQLNKQGIYVSTGSACDSMAIEPSHVLRAILVDEDYIKGSIRISFGCDTKVVDLLTACDAIVAIVKKIHDLP
jgi:cysteine desulfurase